MKNFDYHEPRSLKDAMALLSRFEGRGVVMAGGTDLIVEMRSRDVTPEQVIALRLVPQLDTLAFDEKTGLRIGAGVRLRDLETSPLVREKFPILSQSAGYVGSVQVRHKATVGGNLCHAAPSADMAPALLGLGAVMQIAGPGGERTAPIEEFFTGPGKTILAPNEILTEIRVPSMAARSAGVYLKFSPRKAMDLAVVGVASIVTLDATLARCEEIRIALGAVAPTPVRAREAEGLLRGQALEEAVIARAAQSAARESKPITDIRASEWYRRQLVEELVKRSVRQAWETVRSKGGGK